MGNMICLLRFCECVCYFTSKGLWCIYGSNSQMSAVPNEATGQIDFSPLQMKQSGRLKQNLILYTHKYLRCILETYSMNTFLFIIRVLAF